jgi:hypothetical protein
MQFLEKDLEQIIYEADKDALRRKGLYISGKLLRQLRIGNYGIADLVEFNRPFFHEGYNNMVKGVVRVYELKQNNISVSAFLQAIGYVKGIKTYLEKRGYENYFNFEIVLIGKDIDKKSEFIFLTDIISANIDDDKLFGSLGGKFALSFYTYSYDLNGISFNHELGYDLTNKGF